MRHVSNFAGRGRYSRGAVAFVRKLGVLSTARRCESCNTCSQPYSDVDHFLSPGVEQTDKIIALQALDYKRKGILDTPATDPTKFCTVHTSSTFPFVDVVRSVSLERGADSSEGPARSVAKHEAALFAHLAGNAELLLESDLTQSWEDQVGFVGVTCYCCRSFGGGRRWSHSCRCCCSLVVVVVFAVVVVVVCGIFCVVSAIFRDCHAASTFVLHLLR